MSKPMAPERITTDLSTLRHELPTTTEGEMNSADEGETPHAESSREEP